MSKLDFVRLVWKLRKAQKRFFEFGGRSQLEHAERLEREVDKMLEEMGFEGAQIKQMRLDAPEAKKGGEDG